MKRYYGFVVIIISLVFTTMLYGQILTVEMPKSCTNKTANKGKYKVLSISAGKVVQFNLKIKPKHRTNENYIAIVKEFKEKYCEVNSLMIIYYKSKEQWRIDNPFDRKEPPLAIFYTRKDKGDENENEVIKVYKSIDGKIETQVLSLEMQEEEETDLSS